MRKILFTLVAIFGLLASQSFAAETIPGSTFKPADGWIGFAHSENGNFAYCSVSTVYPGQKLILTFGLMRDSSNFMISVGNTGSTSWNLVPGEAYDARMEVDNNGLSDLKGIAVSTEQITFYFIQQPRATMAFVAMGSTLHIVGNSNWTLNLDGGNSAILALDKCVKNHNR